MMKTTETYVAPEMETVELRMEYNLAATVSPVMGTPGEDDLPIDLGLF